MEAFTIRNLWVEPDGLLSKEAREMSSRPYFTLVLASILLLSSQATAKDAQVPSRAASTTNNVVTGTIIHDTWDPGDPLTISGDLRDNFDGIERVPCYLGSPAAYASQAVLSSDGAAVTPAVGNGHRFCGATPLTKTFSPGTNSAGHFSLTVAGGGVSWLTGSGTDPEGVVPPGSTMSIVFSDSYSEWRVYCGSNDWGFVCESVPHIYGVLASPDLNSDGRVDAGDLGAFASYFGQPMTRDFGWQADFNHSGGPTVDAGDLAYFAGRMGQGCGQGKPTAVTGNYAMDVHNLELSYVKAELQTFRVTNSQIIAAWDQMGLSYDHRAAAEVLSRSLKPGGTESSTWANVKTFYR